MLTGESTPVVKSALPAVMEEGVAAYHPETGSKYTVFSGSKIIQARGVVNHEDKVQQKWLQPTVLPERNEQISSRYQYLFTNIL